MSCENRDSVLSSFPHCMPLFGFLALSHWLARPVVLRSEAGHSWWLPIRGNTFRASPLSTMSAGDFGILFLRFLSIPSGLGSFCLLLCGMGIEPRTLCMLGKQLFFFFNSWIGVRFLSNGFYVLTDIMRAGMWLKCQNTCPASVEAIKFKSQHHKRKKKRSW